eukprot:912353-Prorocentrum_minimum.AAC.2
MWRIGWGWGRDRLTSVEVGAGEELAHADVCVHATSHGGHHACRRVQEGGLGGVLQEGICKGSAGQVKERCPGVD